MTFGKVMGGGFPAAAFGGRADVMAMLSPEGPVYQAGTLSGNPVATTAGLATLRLATDAVYAHLDTAAAAITRGRRGRAGRRPGCRTSCSTPATCSACSSPTRSPRCRDFDGARRSDTGALTAFFHAMLDQGVYLPPSAFEVWFVSAAHDDRAVRPDRSRAARRCPGRRRRRRPTGPAPAEEDGRRRADDRAPAAAR